MSSRERILRCLKENSVEQTHALPQNISHNSFPDLCNQFKDTLIAIGGSAIELDSVDGIQSYIDETFPEAKSVVTGLKEISPKEPGIGRENHKYPVDVAILYGQFAVAENGAVWITDRTMPYRALPFICEHLILVVNKSDIVPTMHEAYARTDRTQYDFGTFIAGPSKTADIEQSLVLGAHGPKSMTVVLVKA